MNITSNVRWSWSRNPSITAQMWTIYSPWAEKCVVGRMTASQRHQCPNPQNLQICSFTGQRRSKVADGIKPTSQVTWRQERLAWTILVGPMWSQRPLKMAEEESSEKEIWGPKQGQRCAMWLVLKMEEWAKESRQPLRTVKATDGSCPRASTRNTDPRWISNPQNCKMQ